MENKKSIISFIVGIVIFGISMYMVYYITTLVNFDTTTVIINNDKNLWKFLSFIPILVGMFTGALCIVNAIFNIKPLHIFGIILCVGLIFFFDGDLHDFVTVIPAYNEAITESIPFGNTTIPLLSYVNVLGLGAGALLVDIVIQLVKKRPRRREVNLETLD